MCHVMTLPAKALSAVEGGFEVDKFAFNKIFHKIPLIILVIYITMVGTYCIRPLIPEVDMRESILTIPVNEVFEPTEGCPFCRMRDTVETHICEYIMGAAMMESDVRTETNQLGFCHRHYQDMLGLGNRLSLGLMLNSHIENVREEIFAKKGILDALKKDKRSQKAAKTQETCFVCSKTDWGMNHMAKSFFMMYRDDSPTNPKFKPMFCAQEFICMPHYAWIRGLAANFLGKGDVSVFLNELDTLVGNYAAGLNADVSAFCNSFDYRNAGKLHSPEMEHVRTSVNRSIYFLTGRKPD